VVRRFDEIEEIVQTVVEAVDEYCPIEAAYLFGSYVTGTPHEDSDIDIAIFARGVEKMSADQRMDFIAEIQKKFDVEIELHLFPAEMLDEKRPTNFIGYIVSNGKKIAA
jgi:predicted nucleotidyltransferase